MKIEGSTYTLDILEICGQLCKDRRLISRAYAEDMHPRYTELLREFGK